MVRLAIVYKDGEVKGQTFNTFDEAETFVLSESENGIIRADAIDNESKERKTLWKE